MSPAEKLERGLRKGSLGGGADVPISILRNANVTFSVALYFPCPLSNLRKYNVPSRVSHAIVTMFFGPIRNVYEI